jgi:hypothetical protein
MYLTYTEYTDMGGTLEETAFNDIGFEAEGLINYRTFDRLKKDTVVPEAVKRCMYRLIQIIQIQRNSLNLGQDASGTAGNSTQASVASQSNDGVSISYNTMAPTNAYELANKQCQKTIENYLTGVTNELGRKVLYRGIYPNE